MSTTHATAFLRAGLVLSLLTAAGCASGGPAPSRQGVVVSVSIPASEAGAAALRAGGNAVDAAVATAFALAVTDPEAGNIGGGGFMLIAGAGVSPTVVDYRETAPAAVTPTTFATTKPAQALLVGVPGTVRGLAAAHAKYGKLPWPELVAPAVKLAFDGFAVDAHLADGLNSVLRTSPGNAELRRVFGKPDGTLWGPGDRLTQPDLAHTLTLIATAGPEGFYAGETADKVTVEMRKDSGLITAADLADYKAVVREPVHGTFRGYDVYAPPPPSGGGDALVEMLNVLENFDLKAQGRWDPRTLHLIIEAMRRAYCDRASYLGDPAFTPLPPATLTDKAYAKTLAAGIDARRATPSEALVKGRPIQLAEPAHTTHFSVIDANGLAVSNTYTIEELFGSRIAVRGAGFLLNNELGDFNPRPGQTDRAGLIGTPPNEARGGKRPLSSMTPTILMRDGQVVLVTGSPGGRTITNTVLQVVLNVAEFGMSPREAVDAPRLHEQWFPDEVRVEPALARDHAAAIESLRAMGHHIEKARGVQGDAHTIGIDPVTHRVLGAPDLRRNANDVPATQ